MNVRPRLRKATADHERASRWRGEVLLKDETTLAQQTSRCISLKLAIADSNVRVMMSARRSAAAAEKNNLAHVCSE